MKLNPFFLALVGALTCGELTRADEAKPLDPYNPPENHTAVIHLAGDRHMQALATAWANAFAATDHAATCESNLLGNGTAMPMLYLGLADVALFGRETIVTDNDGFNHVLKYRPLRLEFGTGSLETPGHAPAMALLVHPANPLTRLTLAQVDAIFSFRRFRGAPQAILTWGQLGLTGEWANQPIHLYGDSTESMTGLFFTHTVLGDSRQMNWEHYTEFDDVTQPDGSVTEAAARSATAVRQDKYGLALSTLHYATGGLHPVALAESEASPAFLPTPETLVSRQYPLTRSVVLCVNVRPGQALDPKVRRFLEFVLSDAGQQLLATPGGYLPLSPGMLLKQRAKLRAAPGAGS